MDKLCCFLLLCVLGTVSQAFAHRVNIFAWVDGNSVQVECGFSKSDPARFAVLEVRTLASNKVLQTIKLNEKGTCSFPIPEEAKTLGLLLKVNAGERHQNTWKMEASEFGGTDAEVKTHGVVQKEIMPEEDTLRSLIRQELNLQLAPIRKALAEQQQKEPGLTEIVGGIGWIVGLSGLYLAFRSGKKQG